MANQMEQNPKKSNNAAAKTAKKPNIFVRMGRKLKEVFSELKRVTWPTFPKVVRGTCVVLVVVIAFIVIVTGINYGLQALLNLITGIGA
ncbi:MAG: preprotein translocase subunit SecE [Clostridia bacterium]|nr:preprotein translocase subunit SecE [Clostridia bacterium]